MLYATFTDHPGSEVVVTMRPFAMVMLNGWVADAGVGAESVTFTVKFDVPEAVGVPEIFPVPALNAKPAGRLPEAMLQVRFPVPPSACKVALYAVCTAPAASEVVATVGDGFTITADEAEAVFCATDVAFTVTVNAEETLDGAL